MAKSNYEIIKSYAQSPEIIQRFVEITGSERQAKSYVNSVIIAVASDDKLKECTPQSIMKAAADAANLSLDVDPRLKEAYLVPYGKNATLIPGWRGLRNLAYNTGKVLYINTNAVYEGQEWVEDQMTGKASIEGSPTSREPIGYFAYLETKDHRVNTLYMSVEEIHAHKEKYAKGWNRQGSAWQDEFPKMAKKTVLRQLLDTWAELDTATRERLSELDMEDNQLGEDFPDPSQVTSVEKPKHTNEEIIDTLYAGMKNEDEPTVIDAEYSEEVPDTEPAPKPKKKAPKQEKTNYPGSQSEYYSWIAHGNSLPYIGVSDAKKALEQCNGEIDIAWELLQSWSIERTETHKGKKKDQPKLI